MKCKILRYKVRDQELTEVEPNQTEGLVKGSKGYVHVKVDLDSSWKQYRLVIAQFSNSYDFEDDKAALLINGQCAVPDSICQGDIIYMRIYGKSNNVLNVTNKVAIRQEG